MTRGFIITIVLTAVVSASAAERGMEIANIDPANGMAGRNGHLPPRITEKTEYYEVRGNCEKDLVSEMRLKGPTLSDGRQYDSLTKWYVTWDYNYGRAPRSCTADSFRATIDIVFRYPKWVQTAGAPRQLSDKWNAYMKNLSTHENGHRDRAVQAVTELSRAVAELPPASSCAEIDRRVLALCSQRMQQLSTAEKQYDADTCHGIKQGAYFQ